MNNTIYELRAYIGKSELIYTQIFATLESAEQRVMTLRANCIGETQLNGTINRLELNHETYEFVEVVCYL